MFVNYAEQKYKNKKRRNKRRFLYVRQNLVLWIIFEIASDDEYFCNK